MRLCPPGVAPQGGRSLARALPSAVRLETRRRRRPRGSSAFEHSPLGTAAGMRGSKTPGRAPCRPAGAASISGWLCTALRAAVVCSMLHLALAHTADQPQSAAAGRRNLLQTFG